MSIITARDSLRNIVYQMESVEMNSEVECDNSRASGPFSSDGFTLYLLAQ